MTAAAMTALAGTRLLFSLAKCLAPGMAPSRLNAKNIRLVLVMQATVQKNWPAVEMADHEARHVRASAPGRRSTKTLPPPAVTPSLSWTANRNESSRIQPPMPE